MAPVERKEVDIVSVDPLFLERQRNRYASRAVAYVVWLNGLAAIAVLIGLAHASLPTDQVKHFADAMLVFGAGSLAGLASAFFASVGRSDLSALPHRLAPTFALVCDPCRNCGSSLFHWGLEYEPRHGRAERSPCCSEYWHWHHST